MDESFVVLPSAAASMYKSNTSGDVGAGRHLSGGPGGAVGNAQHTNNASFNATVHVLKRVFEIASAHTQVEQPLYLECMRSLSEELDKQVEEVNRDIRAYNQCLERLSKEQYDALTEEEKLKVEEEERKLEEAIKAVNQQKEEVLKQLNELDLKSTEFEDLEERFWHGCNDFRLQLTAHQFIGNIQESVGTRTGWGAVIVAQLIAATAAGAVHRVCVTTCGGLTTCPPPIKSQQCQQERTHLHPPPQVCLLPNQARLPQTVECHHQRR